MPIAALVACGDGNEDTGEPDGGHGGSLFDSVGEGYVCKNLECQIDQCLDAPKTAIAGTVFDPSGRLPLHHAIVYVPNEPLAAITSGATCNRCADPHSGAPLVISSTDALGNFRLDDVPAGEFIPLVVQLGKWRRRFVLRNVPRCETTIANVRLPRNREEGDIPRIALVTGAADALQCLLRKLDIDAAEFGVAGSEARIHLYRGGGYSDAGTNVPAAAGFAGGAPFPVAETLWNDGAALLRYDAVLLACEGADNDTADHKSPAAKQALYDYAAAGGRVLATHHHATFFSTSPDPAPKTVAQWTSGPAPVPDGGDPRTTSVAADLNVSSPKGAAFRTWLESQGALVDGRLPLLDADHDVAGVSSAGVAWMQVPNPSLANVASIQYLTFGAPVGDACGRVGFGNLHAGLSVDAGSAQDDPTKSFPEGCTTAGLSPQEKALVFLLFDLWSCAQPDDEALVRPR